MAVFVLISEHRISQKVLGASWGLIAQLTYQETEAQGNLHKQSEAQESHIWSSVLGPAYSYSLVFPLGDQSALYFWVTISDGTEKL